MELDPQGGYDMLSNATDGQVAKLHRLSAAIAAHVNDLLKLSAAAPRQAGADSSGL
jgi:hypothetical protein